MESESDIPSGSRVLLPTVNTNLTNQANWQSALGPRYGLRQEDARRSRRAADTLIAMGSGSWAEVTPEELQRYVSEWSMRLILSWVMNGQATISPACSSS